jgi:hypothetical protein
MCPGNNINYISYFCIKVNKKITQKNGDGQKNGLTSWNN